MASSIKELQKQLINENLEKYNTEAERRTKRTLSALEGAADNMSATGKAYFDMLTKTVEASEKSNSSQLSYTTNRIDRIRDNIQAASDLSDAEKQALTDQIAVINKTFEENTSNQGLLTEKLGKVLSDNSVDITSIVAGLTSNNPAIMFATKWIGDRIQKAKEEKMEMQRAIDEAAAGVDVPSGPSEAVEQLQSVNDKLEQAQETNDAWRADQDAESYKAEEERREGARAREDQLEALEAIADKDFNVDVEVEGEGGGFLDGLLGKLGFGAGGLLGGIGSALTAAMPIAAIAGGAAMAFKDGFDIATAALDDDIATEIEGEDIGGVAGSAIGGAIGFALGGPIGAGIGMMVGNFVGETLGEYFDPDTSQLLADSKNQIADRGRQLTESLQGIEDLYAQGLISQEEYNAAKDELNKEISAANDLALDAERVTELEAARQRAAQNYNNLNAQIERMEEAGIAVPQSMYDQLEKAEQAFDAADAAFDEASIALDEKLNPSWWTTVTTSVTDAVNAVATKVQGAVDTARNSVSTLAIPDVAALTEEERADLQAKVDALPEGISSLAGLTNEELVLMAAELEMTPEQVAELDSAQLLAATAKDQIADGLKGALEFGQEKMQEIGATLWSGAEALGIDDELTAGAEFVKQKLEELNAKATEYWNAAKSKYEEVTGKVGEWWDSGMSWLGFGDDEEQPEQPQETIEEASNVEPVNIQDMSDDELRSYREDMRDEREYAQIKVRAAQQGNVTVDGERLSGDELTQYQQEAQNNLDAMTTEFEAIEAERRSRQEAARQAEDEQYQRNLSEQQRLQQGIESGEFDGWFSSDRDERQQLEVVTAAIAEYENRRNAEAEQQGRNRQAMADFLDMPSEPVVIPIEYDAGQRLNAAQSETNQLEAESRSAETNIVAPTSNVVNQNTTIQQTRPRVPVRNRSDDYRSSNMSDY
jgi:hypothetical protein